MKKLLVLLLTALLLCTLTACGSVKIEDTNGPENFSLNTITDQNILKLDLPSGGNAIKISGLHHDEIRVRPLHPSLSKRPNRKYSVLFTKVKHALHADMQKTPSGVVLLGGVFSWQNARDL